MAAAVAHAAPPPVRPPPLSMDFDDDDMDMDNLLAGIDQKKLEEKEAEGPEAYLAYYKYLLPWKQLFVWLNRTYTSPSSIAPSNGSANVSPAAAIASSSSNSLPVSRNYTHREFAFTLRNEAYLRYNSFSAVEDLKREVCRLNPARFEIGPVYNSRPKDRKAVQKALFRPVSRELVFDIDMTDYDEVRTCCSGKGICKRCWAFIAVAVKVIDEMMRVDFSFKHLLWVFSGRRGIHCWISDEEACNLSDDARRAIVGWVGVVTGTSSQAKKIDVAGNGNVGGLPTVKGGVRALHPSLRRALDGADGAAGGPLKIAFDQLILRDQDCFRETKQWETLLQLLPEGEIETVGKLRTKWANNPFRPSLDKWDDVRDIMAKSKRREIWLACMEDIIIQYTYPRIDKDVSKHLNHLLKSPFVIHPATGKVCVPLHISQVDNFDPDRDCPTIAQLLREMNEAVQKDGVELGKEKGSMSSLKAYWGQTSLKPFVDTLDRHNQAVLRDLREAKKVLDAKSMDF